MIRRIALAAGLVLGAAVLVAALVWIVRLTARLETGEAEARRLAVREERIRLALWRMDSALATFLALENARPVDPPAADTEGTDPAWVAERFELAAAKGPGLPDAARAPQEAPPPAEAPAPAEPPPPNQHPPRGDHEVETRRADTPPPARDPAPATGPVAVEPEPPAAKVAAASPAPATRESEIQRQLNVVEFEQRQRFAGQQSVFVPGVVQPPAGADPEAAAEAAPETASPSPASEPDRDAEPADRPAHGEATEPDPPARAPDAGSGETVRTAPPPDRNRADPEPPNGGDRGGRPSSTPAIVPSPPAPRPRAAARNRPSGPTGVLDGLEPRWEDSGLVLARRIVRDGAEAEQGIVLDQTALSSWLLAEVGDLVPGGALEPAPVTGPADPGRRLALLPLRLVPGPPPALPDPGWSPTRVGLATAIAAILLVATAAALTLVTRLRLARRRTEFASAVIHELRTPLTTFRVTTELLADDMVPPAERPEHLRTLRGEAERLGRLVDNVLAFARLERRARPRTQPLALAAWLREAAERLARRAAEDGLDLHLDVLEAIEGIEVEADPTALERILDNLCDNSCKYARDAVPPRIEVTAELSGRFAVVRWRDHGPGLGGPGTGRAASHRLFRPYRRGGAAETSAVPGVGLGLALSRGLARSIGGDLRAVEPVGRDKDRDDGGGAAFELRLPRLNRPA